MEPRRWSVATTVAGLGICVMVGCVAGCDDTSPNGDHPQPGLEVLTPRVGVVAGARSALLVRSDRPARVSVYDGDVSVGTGRSSRAASKIRFAVSAVSDDATVQVIAVAEGGATESSEVALVGLGAGNVWETEEPFADIAAVGPTAVAIGALRLWSVSTGDDTLTATSAAGQFQAIAADHAQSLVIVADRTALVSTYHIDAVGSLALTEQIRFAIYEGSSPPQEVSDIHALSVTGSLLAAATSQGMAIVDRSTVDAEGEYCRTASAMAAKLEPAIYDPSMVAVVVTAEERVVAGGAYLNLYDAAEDDPGTCDAAMRGRTTTVIAPPEDGQPWDVVALGLTASSLWVGRRDHGILRVPAGFEPEHHYFPEGALWRLEADALPLPRIVGFAEGEDDSLWVALSDADGVTGGLALIGTDGSSLWVDIDAAAGAPRAVDRSVIGDTTLVWVLTETTIVCFEEP